MCVFNCQSVKITGNHLSVPSPFPSSALKTCLDALLCELVQVQGLDWMIS